MKGYVIALDQGTTSSRAIVFDRAGQIVSIAQYDYPQIYPRPGWSSMTLRTSSARRYARWRRPSRRAASRRRI